MSQQQQPPPPPNLYPGRRFAQIVKLKPEHIGEYRACHARVWPDVLAQIKQCNIVDCRFPFHHSHRPTSS